MMRKLAIGAAAVLVLTAAGSAAAASRFFIRGAGDGHGVGMSQYGAYGYALHGANYRFILSHYYQGTSIGTTDPEQLVRVLIATGSARFTGAAAADNKLLKPGATYRLQALADGSLKLLTASGRPVGTFAAPLKVTGPGPLTLAGVGSYAGSFEFRPDGSGGVESVDAVALDQYVRGVVADEMPASWPAAALEAQAVAARTFAITNDVGGSAFDVYSDTRSQMYGGIGAQTPSTDAAVAATTGQVVTYDGSPAITYFFASSGGHTESVQYAFPGAEPEPWLVGVPDPYDGAGGNPFHRWRIAISTARAAARLGSLVKGALRGIVVLEHGVSPRIVLASVVGSRGSSMVSGVQLEQLFGLMSTWATFTTITTLPGPGTAAIRRVQTAQATARALKGPHLAAALAPLELAARLLAGPSVHGSVFPARVGSPITVQARHGRRWRTVARIVLGANGGFGAAVPGTGTYRVVYQGLDGPAVTVA